MGQANQPLEGFSAVLGHPVFTGDRQRFDDVDPLIDEVVFQLLVAVEGEVTGHQATDDQGRQDGEGENACSQAIFGHTNRPPVNRVGDRVDGNTRALWPYLVILLFLWDNTRQQIPQS